MRLDRWSAGDAEAFDTLVPVVYADLRRLAQCMMRRERNWIDLTDDLAWIGSANEEILDLYRALERLEALDPRKAGVAEMRCFLTFTTAEVAEALDLSLATAERDLQFARAWLYRELRGGGAAHESRQFDRGN